MAFPASFWFGDTLSDALTNSISLNLDTDMVKVALYTNSLAAVDKNTDQGTYGSSPWNANECASANYTAGGSALTNPGLSIASGKIVFADSAATLVWSDVTFTPRGCLVYSDTLSPKRGIVALNFGADIPITAGTFTITWDPINKLGAITF